VAPQEWQAAFNALLALASSVLGTRCLEGEG